MSMMLVPLLVFIAVVALIGGIVLAVGRRPGRSVEERLDSLAQPGGISGNPVVSPGTAAMSLALEESPEIEALENYLAKWVNLRLVLQQADSKLTIRQLFILMVCLTVAAVVLGICSPMPLVVTPLAIMFAIGLPIFWLYIRRHLRLGKFEAQLPDAMALLARSLRAGHSLADGIQLISEEMSDPISKDFHRCYERQHLGIPLEEALEEMAKQVPLLDVRFFVGAVIMQRQTGGDTAEILDKIGHLIRERFQIRMQIKALTGEGRMSGVVLIALPILLGIYNYFRNPDYFMILFRDPLGVKMIIGAIILQILGALVIRKIITIKV